MEANEMKYKFLDSSKLKQQLEKTEDHSEKLDLLYKIASHYFENTNYQDAIIYGEMCYDIMDHEHHNRGNLIQLIGTLSYNLHKYEKAIAYFKEHLEYARKEMSNLSLEMTLNYIGLSYRELGELENAIQYYKKANAIFKEKGDTEGVGGTLLNIGHLYISINELETAQKYFKQSLTYMKKVDKPANIAMVYGALGNVSRRKKDFANAEKYFLKGLEQSKLSGNNTKVLFALNNLGLLNINNKDYGKAKEYYSEGLEIAEKGKDVKIRAILYSNIGNACIYLNEYSEAEENLNKGMELAKEINSLEIIAKNYKMQSDLYKGKDDTHKVYDALMSYIRITEEIDNKKESEKIRELEIRLETKQKEHEAEIYKLKNTELKNALMELQEAYVKQEEAHQEILDLERKNSILAMAVTANHEITQPLMVLSGNIEMLHMKLEMEKSKYLNDKAWERITESISKIKEILSAYKESTHFEFDKYTDNVNMVNLKNS